MPALSASAPLAGAAAGAEASIAAARSSSARASSALDGHIGLKLYHWSGAARMVRSRRSAICCVARWRSAGLEEGTLNISPASTWNRPPAIRLTAMNTMTEPVLAASVAGPAGSVVQAPNSFTGMPSL